jgi:hypothetical protein
MYSNFEFSRIGPTSYHALENVPSIWQGFIMTGWSQPYDYTELVSEGILNGYIILFLFILVALSLMALLFKKGIKYKIIFSSLFLIGVFLTTGLNDPGGQIFGFLYGTLPVLRIFRDPYTFSFYIAISLSILLAFFIRDIIDKIQNIIKIKPNIIKISLLFIVISLIIISGSPLLNGNYSNQLQTITFPEDYEDIYKQISSEEELSRILFFPSLQPIKINDKEYAGRDNMIHFPPKPSFPQNVDRLNRFNRFHSYTLLNLREEKDISNLLKVTSTEYILDRENYESWYYKYVPGDADLWSETGYKDILKQFEVEYSSSNITLYNSKYSPFLKITKPYFGIGNLDLIKSLPDNVFNDTSIIFLDDIPKIFLDSLNLTTLTNQGQFYKEPTLYFTNETQYVRLKTEERSSKNGWAYDDTTWRFYSDITADTFFNGINTVLTSAENAKLNDSFLIENEDNYRIFVRIYNNVDGGSIKLNFDDNQYIIDTKDEINNFIWKNLGELYLDKGKHSIQIENLQGVNAISFFTITPKLEYQNFLIDYNQKLSNKNIIFVFEIEKDFYTMKEKDNLNSFRLDDENVLDLESVGQAWKQITIENSNSYVIAVKGNGIFNLSLNERELEFNRQNLSYTYFGPFNLTKGNYNISFTSIGKSTFAEFLFENDLNKWGKETNFFSKELSEDSYEGKYCLKVTTNSEKAPSWSWIKSEPVNITPGNIYRIITHIKYSNVKQTHVPIEGFNETTGKWQQLTQLPTGQDGSSNWKEFDSFLKLSSNISRIRIILNAGWVLDNNSGNATTWFDDIRIYPVNKGVVDKIWIYSSETNRNITELFTKDNQTQIIKYEKISPTSYEVQVNSSEPFLLSFSEAYDHKWIAEIETNQKIKQYKPIPLYDSINGFWIEETGDIKITIKYQPQAIFDYGLIIAMIIIFACLGYIIYDLRGKIKI